MKLPEGWPTEEMIDAVEGLEYDFTPGGSETVTGCVSEEMAREIFTKMLAAAPTPPAQQCKCDMRTKLVGDGCEVCNPELAAELASQEDEPVAEIVCEDLGSPFNAAQIRAHFYSAVPPRGTKLYTRPANDRLRDTAELVLLNLDDNGTSSIEFVSAISRLRAALERNLTPSSTDTQSPA